MTTNKLILTALLAMPLFVWADNQPQMMKTVLTQPTPKAVNFNAAVKQCAKDIDPMTFQAIARTESSFNPYAIGVVSGYLKEQPRNLTDAVKAVKMLRQQGRNFSMGLVQVNVKNMSAYGLTDENIFDICTNLRVGGEILKDCFSRAKGDEQQRLQQALSCYYSGNFRRGFASHDNYVARVVNNAKKNSEEQTILPPQASSSSPQQKSNKVPAIDTSVPVAAVAGRQSQKKSSAPKVAHTKIKRMQQEQIRQQYAKTVAEKPKREWDIFGDFAEF